MPEPSRPDEPNGEDVSLQAPTLDTRDNNNTTGPRGSDDDDGDKDNNNKSDARELRGA